MFLGWGPSSIVCMHLLFSDGLQASQVHPKPGVSLVYCVLPRLSEAFQVILHGYLCFPISALRLSFLKFPVFVFPRRPRVSIGEPTPFHSGVPSFSLPFWAPVGFLRINNDRLRLKVPQSLKLLGDDLALTLLRSDCAPSF